MPKISYAPYKNSEVLALVSEWFTAEYGVEAAADEGFLTIEDLYQSFSEYSIDRRFARQRLNINEFAKCIVACRILDIGGRFRYEPTYEPTVSAITRATA